MVVVGGVLHLGRLTLGPTQPPVQCLPGLLPWGKFDMSTKYIYVNFSVDRFMKLQRHL